MDRVTSTSMQPRMAVQQCRPLNAPTTPGEEHPAGFDPAGILQGTRLASRSCRGALVVGRRRTNSSEPLPRRASGPDAVVISTGPGR